MIFWKMVSFYDFFTLFTWSKCNLVWNNKKLTYEPKSKIVVQHFFSFATFFMAFNLLSPDVVLPPQKGNIRNMFKCLILLLPSYLRNHRNWRQKRSLFPYLHPSLRLWNGSRLMKWKLLPRLSADSNQDKATQTMPEHSQR